MPTPAQSLVAMALREQVVVRNGRPVGRYAPSPTGDLHLGNLRTALLAWTEMRRRNGIFILRIEDIDTPRTVADSERTMLEDLRWLGLDWDEGPDVGGPAGPYRQSERVHYYKQALEELRLGKNVFACGCARKDLRSDASAPHGSEGPVYPGTCRDLNIAGLQTHNVAWRFRVECHARIVFNDLGAGRSEFDLARDCGDFVVLRRDGLWAYQLACAVDDALMGVTEVLRGADLLPSTPRQIALMQTLALPVPVYHHVPLVVDATGARMSKRDSSCSLRSLRKDGMTANAVRDLIIRAPTDKRCYA